MRIAIAAEGTRGDIHPMLSLGTSFRRAGHEVLICAPPDFREATEECDLEFRPVGRSVREFLEQQSHTLHEGALVTMREGARFFRENIALHFEALIDACAGADRMFGAGTEMAAASIAELHGIPYRFIAYVPGLFPSGEHPPFVVPKQDLPRWVNRLAWWAMARAMNGFLRGEVNRQREQLGLARLRDIVAQVYSSAPLLASEPALGGVPADVRMPVQQIGCLHPFEEEPLPPKLLEFLDQGEPPVYVGFGSMTDPAPEATTRTVLDAIAALGCRAIVSEGWAGLGGLPLPEGVMVIGVVSHPALFRRVAAVVHHGGAGTTTTAARAGAPQVLVPHILDQFYWAQRVERLGLGPPAIRRRRLDTATLAATLREVVGNEILAERAASLGVRLRDALVCRPEPARVLL